MSRKPVPWIAAILGLIAAPLAMLYVRRPRAALIFLVASIVLGTCGFIGVVSGQFVGLLSWGFAIAGAVFAYRYAKACPDAVAPWYARWFGLLAIAALSIAGIVSIRVFLYEPFIIPSSAMLPTLPLRANIIVQKHGYGRLTAYGFEFGRLPGTSALKRGDIIVFDYPRDPSQTYIKRIIGLPGDRVAFVGKNVVVNGRETRLQQLENYLDFDALTYLERHRNRIDATTFETLSDAKAPATLSGMWEFPMKESCTHSGERTECLVPAGRYFVMGDNRDNSADSRYWGYVRADQVVGKLIKVFPPAEAD